MANHTRPTASDDLDGQARRRRWPPRTRLTVIIISVVAFLGLVVLGLSLLDRRDFNALTLGGPVSRIDVQVADGDVELVPGTGDNVVVERTSNWRFRRPDADAYVEQGTARIRSGCPRIVIPGGNCSVTHRIEVPDGVRVDVRTNSGRVWMEGLTGWVRVVTTEGRVVGDGLLSPEVLIDTSGGSVRLDFAQAPSRVAVLSGGRNVRLWLPSGPYEIDVDAADGNVDIEVDTEDLAERVIEIDTDGGDVSVLRPGTPLD